MLLYLTELKLVGKPEIHIFTIHIVFYSSKHMKYKCICNFLVQAPLSALSPKSHAEQESELLPRITHVESEQIKTTLQKGLMQGGGKSCTAQNKEAR